MPVLYLDTGRMTIRKYAVAGTSGKTMVSIELAISDPRALGYLLEEIEKAKAELAAGAAPRPADEGEPRRKAGARTGKKAAPKAITHQAPLALTYREDF